MTEQEIRIALAEWDGWVQAEGPANVWFWYKDKGKNFPVGASGTYQLPDYPNDLNAVHGLRKNLSTTMERVNYMNNLRTVVGRRMPKNKVNSPLVSDFDCVNAEADEHCEALLRTLGKWKD